VSGQIAAATPLTIAVPGAETVSALLLAPAHAGACFVLAHGAGAGMTHPFLAALADLLAARAIATLRYQFPYMEKATKRPDPPKLAQATVHAAAAEAARRLPGLPLIAGGKSFGGRMTSQAQAASALAGVRGLVFVGFPLHPAGQPSTARAGHLRDVHVPMLFLQGTRDELAQLDLITPLAADLGSRATLRVFDDADHSFHVRKRSGNTDAQVLAALADTIAAWTNTIVSRTAQ
jgi:predicted alpha/beta-hydrolase family hydrolase